MSSLLALAFVSLATFSSCDEKKKSVDCGDCSSEADPNSGIISSGGGGSTSAAPAIGTGPTFSNITYEGYTITWTAGVDSVTEKENLEYKVVSAASAEELSTLDQAHAITSTDIVLDWSKDVLSVTVSGQGPLQSLAYAVLVRDEAGNAALYPAQVATTSDADAPTVGTAIAFSNVSHENFSVSWGAANSLISTREKLKYKAVISTRSEAIDTIAEVEAVAGAGVLMDYTENQLAVAKTGLHFGTTYYVAVLVKDEQERTSIYTPSAVETSHHRLIFITTVEYASTVLGSTATADAACEDQIPSGRSGTFKALFVNGTRTACTHAYCNPIVNGDLNDWPLLPNTSYESEEGALVFTTDARSTVPSGVVINKVSTVKPEPAWTGLNGNWTHASNTCQNWTSTLSADHGTSGWASNPNDRLWSNYSWPCVFQHRLYCVEQ